MNSIKRKIEWQKYGHIAWVMELGEEMMTIGWTIIIQCKIMCLQTELSSVIERKQFLSYFPLFVHFLPLASAFSCFLFEKCQWLCYTTHTHTQNYAFTFGILWHINNIDYSAKAMGKRFMAIFLCDASKREQCLFHL